MHIGGDAQPPAGHTYLFNGQIDEVSLYSRALSAGEIASIYNAGAAGKCSDISPSIITEPTSQAVNVGDTATFAVSVTGTPPLSYQWSVNSTNIADATNAMLTLTNVQLNQAGGYSVVVSNAFGSTNSVTATLTVSGVPPSITTQPVNQTVNVGGTATFAVVATGTSPLSYQWSMNSTNIVNATNASLTLTNLQLNQAGSYSVSISNAFGLTNSLPATLTVNPLPPCDPPASGLVNWWRAEGDAADSVGTNNGTLNGTASFVAGEVGQAFSFDGTSGFVSVPDAPSLDSFTNAMTIELWTKSATLGNNADWKGMVTKGNVSWGVFSTTFANTAYVLFTGVTPKDLFGTRNINDGQWHLVVATYDGSTIALYVDGTLDASEAATGQIAQDSFPMYIGGDAQPPIGHTYLFNGQIDEVSLYNRALSAGEIAAIYNAGGAGKCVGTPPTITTQPTNQTVTVGGTATFAVVATGTPLFSYQWSVNSTNIADATNASLTLANVQLNQAGGYSVVVSNAFGSTNSVTATLTVTGTPPSITTQPTNQTVTVGGTAGFAVVATGTSPLSYQWSVNSTNIADATNASLTLANVQLNQAGGYSVVVSNAFGSTNSVTATLTVNPLPPCDPPSSGLMNWWRAEGNAADSVGTNNGTLNGTASFVPGEVGQAFSFDGTSGFVSVPDAPSLDSFTNAMTIELWMKSGILGNNADWKGMVTKGNVSWGVFAASSRNTAYTLFTGVNPPDLYGTRNINDGQWHLVVATYDGSTIALYVDGTLDASEAATGQIAQDSFPMYIGGDAQPPFGHTYLFNGQIDEVSLYNRALSAPEIAAIYNAGSFGKCSAISPSIITEPTNKTVNVGATAMFSVLAAGTGPLSYQWSIGGTNIQNATNSVLTLTDVQFNQAGSYSVSISNVFGSTNSTTAALTVNPAPPCDPPASGLVNWWRAEGDATDSVGTNNGAMQGTASFVAGEVGQAFSFDGTSGFVSVPDAPSLDSFTNAMTIELWMKSGSLGNNTDWKGMVSKGNVSWGLFAATFTNTAYALFNGANPPALYGTRNINDGQWHLVVATYDGSTIALYVDGTLDASEAATGQIAQDSFPMNIGGDPQPPAGHTYLFNGPVDEVSLYNRALSAGEVAAVYNAGSAGKCVGTLPTIITQPTNQTVFAGQTATFNVAVTGTPPLYYQWSVNNSNILNATNATLTLTNVQTDQAGSYSVLVTNMAGTTLSSNAVLTVIPNYSFVWSAIPTPRFVNAPFSVTIQAMLTNAIYTNFNGTVSLTTTNGVIVIPAVSDNFTQGTWTGTIKIGQAVSNLVLEAADSNGKTGMANPIDIVAPPSLATAVSGNTFFMSWPVNPSGFVLETATDLNGPWVPTGSSPIPIGGQNLEEVQISNTNAFYRLRFTGP